MEATIVYTSVQCPNVLALQQFVLAQCGAVNRALVREVVEQSPRFPVVSLNDFNRILQSWHFDTFAFKATVEQLARLEGPLLAHCTWPHEDRYFVVIRGVSDGVIHYFSPFRGEVREPIDAFEQHWSGALLVAQPTKSVFFKLLQATDDESMAAVAYQRENVRAYPDFFSVEECEFIIEYTENKALFERSLVEYNDNESKASVTRTSYSAFLKNRQKPVFQAIYQRVSELLQVDVTYIENLQCVRYGEGQQFKPHFDSGPTNHRLHTLLVYLNDDFTGGETYFPELNASVKPTRGTALYFLNRTADNTVFLYSAHAGLPISQGQKYACNIWVRNQPIT
jgi:hypothetical protein